MSNLARKIDRHRQQQDTIRSTPRQRGFFIPLPVTGLAIGLLVAILVGGGVFAYTLWPKDPGEHSADAGFLRDMFTHHSQAVAMSMVIRDRTSDPDLLALATDIALTQSTQMGQMQGYLELWDLPITGEDKAMTWMGHPTDGLMPGMATQDQIDQLSTLPVDQAEVLFLQLMIRHHQGGVEMAEAALERCDQDDVRFMAERMAALQQGEIDLMNQMLESRGQPPITDPLPQNHEGM